MEIVEKQIRNADFRFLVWFILFICNFLSSQTENCVFVEPENAFVTIDVYNVELEPGIADIGQIRITDRFNI